MKQPESEQTASNMSGGSWAANLSGDATGSTGDTDTIGAYGAYSADNATDTDTDTAWNHVDPQWLRYQQEVKRRTRRRRKLAGIGALAAIVVAVAAVTVPIPYVADMPGPTLDVLSANDSVPMIEISGTDPETGEEVSVDPVPSDDSSTGQLRMVTVSEIGGPGNRLTALNALVTWFKDGVSFVPYNQVYPDSVTPEQISSAQQAMMESSQSAAGVAALEYLGWTVPATVTISGTTEDSHATGKVEEGDVLLAITTPDGVRHPVDSASVPFTVPPTVEVGETLTLEIERDGDTLSVPIQTISGGEGTTGSRMGIYVTSDVDMPLDISYHELESIGGPSAGTMFALGIIDRLTPGDMTGGQVIAGTGEISFAGEVGAIGGIQQKMVGAQRDGATWFLAPASNCNEVVGHVPDGLTVVKVSTLAEAVDAVEAIAAGTGDQLPTCQAE